ncbi:MAG: hypothetical protein ABL951_05625 [Alphaproteobacteria bacterium]
MSYHGDIALGQTIDFQFNTFRFSTGAPFTLAGSPTLAAYVGNSTTQITAGLTLTVDFDAKTGSHNVRCVATSGNGYAAATDVTIVLEAGTVDSVSVANAVVGSFSIENRRSNVTHIAGAAVSTTTAQLGVNVVQISTDATAADNAEAFFDGTGYAGTGNVIPTVSVLTGHTAQTGDAYARLGAPAGASVSADIAAVKSDTAAILDDTGTAGVVLTAAERNATADALLNRNVSGGSSTGRLVKQALHFLRNKWSVSGGTLTVTDTDDTTTSWTAAVSTTAGDPVSTLDPS